MLAAPSVSSLYVLIRASSLSLPSLAFHHYSLSASLAWVPCPAPANSAGSTVRGFEHCCLHFRGYVLASTLVESDIAAPAASEPEESELLHHYLESALRSALLLYVLAVGTMAARLCLLRKGHSKHNLAVSGRRRFLHGAQTSLAKLPVCQAARSRG